MAGLQTSITSGLTLDRRWFAREAKPGRTLHDSLLPQREPFILRNARGDYIHSIQVGEDQVHQSKDLN